jgi:4-hydroxy-tetrahydrodipicolinate reductase
MIKVGVLGARGRMGAQVCQAVAAADGMDVAAEVDQHESRDPLASCDVVVDFTSPDAVMGNLHWCVRQGLDTIVGTSGFGEERLAEVRKWLGEAPAVRVLVVPNFSIGAVLMMRFAAEAARFFPSAEIIELHHAGKLDAPSGTAGRTAALISEARTAAGLGSPPDATVTAADGARGTRMDTVRVHSIRLTGLVAHQEVLFGGVGETLTIRHDSLDRASFMPGVVVAIKELHTLPPGLNVGLDPLLGLG